MSRRRFDRAPFRPSRRQRRLGGGEAGDGDGVGGARDVVEPDLLAELDRGGIAAMLAADAELEVLARPPAALAGDAHELADALDIERDEGIVREDALFLIGRDEARRVVARQ